MKTLEKIFTSGSCGFYTNPRTFVQLKREGNIAIYGIIPFKSKNYSIFEVILVDHIKKGTYIPQFKKTYEDDEEFYANSSSWGTKGFTCITLADAEKKFKQLVEKQNEKEEESKNS